MSDAIDCREARDRLQDYLKEELTPARAKEVAAHLERCRHCFSQARFEESFLLMLRIKSPPQEPKRLTQRAPGVNRGHFSCGRTSARR